MSTSGRLLTAASLRRACDAMQAAFDALEMACAYSSTLEIESDTYDLPGLQEIHTEAYTPMSYHLMTSIGTLKMLMMGGTHLQYAEPTLVRAIACYRKTAKLLPKASKYYAQTKGNLRRLENPAVRKFAQFMIAGQGRYGKKIGPALKRASVSLHKLLGSSRYARLASKGKKVDERNKKLRKAKGLD